ncbi:MAG: glycosyltransferase family 39 protein [Candidatus Omnitrophota bacterium]
MKKRNYLFLILIVLSFHIFLNYQILKKSSFFRVEDEGGIVVNSLFYYRAVFADNTTSFSDKLHYIFELYGNCHPHLVDLAGALSWKILYSLKLLDIDLMVLMVNSIFLLVLLSSVYGIGSMVFNRNVGVLSAALVSMFPVVFGHSRVAMLDFPLMCMISLGFYLLLKTRGFSSVSYSLLAGIALGLSQATKETAFVFILGPLIYYSIRAYPANNKKRALLNFVMMATCFFAVSAIIYLRPENLHVFKIFFGKITYIKSPLSPFHYLSNFIEMTGPLVSVITLPLLAHYLVNIKGRDKFLLIWFIIPIALFSLSQNKTIRFLLPVLPAFALMVSSEADKIKLSKEFKKTVYAMLILIPIVQFAFFNTGLLDTKIKSIYFETGILHAIKDEHPPDSVKLLEVFNMEAKMNKGVPKKVLFLFSIGKIGWPFWLNVVLHQLPFDVADHLRTDEAQVVDSYGIDWNEKILEADYIIDKTGSKPGSDCAKHILKGLEDGFSKHKGRFDLIAKIKLSFDGSVMYVYRKSESIGPQTGVKS